MTEVTGRPAPPFEPELAEVLASFGDRPVRYTDRTIPGPAGAPDLTVSIVERPDRTPGGPAVCYIHGGGMILGDRWFGTGPVLDWDRGSNETGWNACLGDLRESGEVPAYAAPARAADLSGLPPTFIDAGSAEVFRDEDVSYASRIWAAGGECELHVWPGGFHAFDMAAPAARLSQEMIAARASWLRRTLGY
jgi:acetyl esterase/lipase